MYNSLVGSCLSYIVWTTLCHKQGSDKLPSRLAFCDFKLAFLADSELYIFILYRPIYNLIRFQPRKPIRQQNQDSCV